MAGRAPHNARTSHARGLGVAAGGLFSRPRYAAVHGLLGLALLAATPVTSGCHSGGAAGPEPDARGGPTSSGDESSAEASRGTTDSAGPPACRDEASAEAPQRFDPGDIPFRGNPEGRVVVQVFSDFECPYCSRARDHATRLLADFASVRFEYRHFPLSMHPSAHIAAQAAVEAYAQGGNETFWCYHDAVFDHQDELSRERLLGLAGRCGVDRYTLERALDDRRHVARVERDRSEAQQLGVQGTPSFTVNGALVDGGDYPDLEEAVDNAR